MNSPEFNSADFDPSMLPNINFDPASAPADEISELLEMQPKGLSLADAWMIRAAGVTKEELQSILDHGFTLMKGPPKPELEAGLLSDHELQLLEEGGFDVQPIRKLMTLGYSVVFIDEPSTLPEYASGSEEVTDPVSAELERLDALGFNTHPLKVLLSKGYLLTAWQPGHEIQQSVPLDSKLKAQLIDDGFTLVRRDELAPSGSPQPAWPYPGLADLGPPKGNSLPFLKGVAEPTNTKGLTDSLINPFTMKGPIDRQDPPPPRQRSRSSFRPVRPSKGKGGSSAPSYSQGMGSGFGVPMTGLPIVSKLYLELTVSLSGLVEMCDPSRHSSLSSQLGLVIVYFPALKLLKIRTLEEVLRILKTLKIFKTSSKHLKNS